VIAAATNLFEERGPAATSIRDIASRSRVNQGLIHRHFGSKSGVVAAVLDQLNNDTVAVIEQARRDPVDEAVSRYLRILARSILDGYPVGELQQRFPFVADLVEQARLHHDDDTAARFAAGHAIALQLGWRLFEPFIRTAAGLDSVPPEQIRKATTALSETLLRL
jgi:AcrR family transcriptional regulator